MDKYEALEGKIIDFIKSSGEIIKARVVGCDPDIGITIVAKNNSNWYLACSNGPLSPLWRERQKGFSKKRHKIIFNMMINNILQGIYDEEKILKKWKTLHGNDPVIARKEYCPFNQ